MRFKIIALLMLMGGVAASGATITRDATTTTFTETTPEGTIQYTFKKCMANELYTFYQVALDGNVVNSAQYSDNIGPFLVTNYGWIGGNHTSDSGQKTAKTIDLAIKVDGTNMPAGTLEGQVMEVIVINELYMPDGSIFAIENVKYSVAGNSIEIWCTHDYKITNEVTVERYYGMQSMFENETEILAPGGKKYNKWLTFTPGGSANAINIKQCDAMDFSVFVEKSDKCYQAAYMAREDLGKRSKVGIEDVVYIGNSYNKSYHKLMGNAKVRPGNQTKWHGVYSWFKTPIADTFRTQTGDLVFEYPAYVGGKPATMKVNSKGLVSIQAESGVEDVEKNESLTTEYYNLQGIRLESPVSGQMCLKRQGQEFTKLVIK